MKKLLILLGFFLAACSVVTQAPAASQPSQRSAEEVKAAAQATMSALQQGAGKTQAPAPPSDPSTAPSGTDAQPATADPQPPIAWSIQLIQDGNTVVPQDGGYRLRRAPFTIRVQIPKAPFAGAPLKMFINVQDNDENYQDVHAGSILTPDWTAKETEPNSFAIAGGAEPYNPGSNGLLIIDQLHGASSNYLVYREGEETRWNRVQFTETDIVLERDFSGLILVEGEGNTQSITLENYTGSILYLVFFLEYREGPVVTEDEFQKAILVFE